MANKPAPTELFTTTADGQSWKLDLATRRWELTQDGKTLSGADPHRLAVKMETTSRMSAPVSPGAPDTSAPQRPQASRLVVRVKRASALGESDQSSNLEVLHVFTPANTHAPYYATPAGERVWDHAAGPLLEPGSASSAQGLVHAMAFAKIKSATAKPGLAALRQWWVAKEPTVDASQPAATALSALWPTAAPSKTAWEADGKGGARLGHASIALEARGPYHGPHLALSYEGMGCVLRADPRQFDTAMELGAVMHALFGGSVPSEGIKTWVAEAGWEKKAADRPVQVEVAAAAVVNITSLKKGIVHQETSLLSRSSDGSWRWHPIPLDSLKQAPDVRALQPNDSAFLAHIRELHSAGDAAFSTSVAPWGRFARQEDYSLPEFKVEPAATAEELLAAANQWIQEMSAFVDAHPVMVALRETVAPIQASINAHIGEPASPPPARKRKSALA